MNTIYLFGIGSPFGDDSIGWTALDDLEHEVRSSKKIIFERLASPGSVFRHEFDDSDLIIFIDAMVNDENTGTNVGLVQAYHINQLPVSSQRISSHGLNLKTAIDLLLGLGLAGNRIRVIGIEISLPTQIDNVHGITHASQIIPKNTSTRILNLIDGLLFEYKS